LLLVSISFRSQSPINGRVSHRFDSVEGSNPMKAQEQLRGSSTASLTVSSHRSVYSGGHGLDSESQQRGPLSERCFAFSSSATTSPRRLSNGSFDCFRLTFTSDCPSHLPPRVLHSKMFKPDARRSLRRSALAESRRAALPTLASLGSWDKALAESRRAALPTLASLGSWDKEAYLW
jgi:hypothetical protein